VASESKKPQEPAKPAEAVRPKGEPKAEAPKMEAPKEKKKPWWKFW
jgi:hypothetical protein